MLHRAFLILLFSLSTLQVSAAGFDYLPKAQGAEQEFQSLMDKGNFQAALMAWNSTHASSAFGKSADGQATLGYLFLQNGMALSGLDLILSTNPSKLNSSLLKLLSIEIKNSQWIQKGWMQTSGGWKNIYNNEAVALKIKSRKDIQKAFAQVDRLPKDNANQKARILWQIATQAPIINEVDQSLKALKLLKESGQNVIGQDLISSTQARVLYQKGDLDAATQAFNEIPKASSLWVESVEERAWTSLRRDDYDKALGETVTLLSPALAPLVGPESFYIANLLSLKVCDYPRIFKNSETFKKRQKDHLAALQDLSKTGTNKNINAVFEKFDQKGVSVENAGTMVDALPRAAYRDAKFVRFMETRRQWLAESKKASELIANGSTLGVSAKVERTANESVVIANRLKQLAFQRARTLADTEIKEYRQILDRMHIIEGEVIHRLAVDDNLKGQRSKLAKLEDTGEVLVFPYSSDEVWFDELDNYKARVKDCPTLKGAGL